MSDRKAELEKKKAKLQAMREEKKRKEEEKKRKEAEGVTASPAGQQGQGDLREQTERLLEDLGLSPAVPGGGTPVAGAQTPAAAAAAAAAAATPAAQQTAAPIQSLSITKKKVQLSASKITQTNIAPREMVSYSKETQTHNEPLDRDGASSTASTTPSLGQSPQHQLYGNPKFVFPTANLEWDDEFSPDDDTDSLDVAVDTPPISAHSHRMPNVEMARPAETPDDLVHMAAQEVLPPAREMSEEEKTQIMMSEEFQHFLERGARIVERALSEQVDIFADYTGEESEDKDRILTEGEKLKLNRQFFDERWSKHRIVTCMDWSTQYPELLLTSYGNNEESPHDPDGVVLIWNMKYKKTTPEYIFHCQSAVMSSCFAKFHPNLIVGGTYSGQIVLWDNRSNKRTPVQRTPLSAAAHTHPVYCVNVVGTQNAHNLISVSTDGKMCSWNLDMLSQPQDSMELQHKQTKAVAVTTFSFLSGDVNNFVVGSEEGVVYTACRHGSKAGISDMFEGHQGPVTGLDCNTVPGQIDFSPYFITSSFDWTVKLWNIKENRPLHSFEDNSDYVYDARWSPIHPALFATVDGMGRLDLWNLNNETEIPTASTVVEGGVALNKCRWHLNGHQIAAGDDMGKVHIYDVGEPLAVPRNDEWSKFVHTLQELKNNQAEQDEEKASFMSLPLR